MLFHIFAGSIYTHRGGVVVSDNYYENINLPQIASSNISAGLCSAKSSAMTLLASKDTAKSWNW